MARPLVSIIVPVFNAADTLQDCLESILSQGFETKELLVLDGGSTDGSLEIIQTFSGQISYTRSHQDNGIYAAMNEGIDHAKGDWLLFLGADDVLCPEILKDIFSAPIAPSTQLILGCVDLVGKIAARVPTRYRCALNNKLIWRNTIHHQGCFYNSSCFENPKLRYEEQFSVLADYDLNLRLYKAGAQAIFRDKTITQARAQGVSKDFTSKLYKEELAVKKRWLSPGQMVVQKVWVWIKYLYKRT